MKGFYECVCGRTFDKPNSFNGHKRSCKLLWELKGKDLSSSRKLNAKNSAKTRQEKNKIQKELELDNWISEKHKCIVCNRIMTYKFGSGLYCSKSCANTREHSLVTKAKISKSVVSSIQATGLISKPNGRYKYGWYNNYWCDSSWELAFLLYHLDNNIIINRNMNEGFTYLFNNKIHTYFPDFIINNIYYEIKGRWDEKVDAKIAQFPKNKTLIILTEKEMKPFIKYCKEKYGKEFYRLYDPDKPSWLNKYDSSSNVE